MQVIQDTNAGGRLGAVLGTGLQELAHHKLSQLSKQYEIQQQRTQFAQGLAPLLGQDTANFLSHLGPEERKSALQNIGALMQLNQQPGQQQGGLEALSQQPEQQQAQLQGQERNPERAKLVQDIFTSPQEKREREKLELQKRQLSLKETKPYIDSLKAQEKAGKESDLRLKRMESLIEHGKLPNAGLWSFLTKFEEAPYISGLTAPFVGIAKSYLKSGNPDIEEFEKLSNDFVKNAKAVFGSRITDNDLRVFMQTIPSLMQTDAGKKKVIANLRSLNDLAGIEAKAARSIIRDNGGIPPIDIEQQVQDKIGSKLDKVANKFVTRE
jgi:hypothetical protein